MNLQSASWMAHPRSMSLDATRPLHLLSWLQHPRITLAEVPATSVNGKPPALDLAEETMILTAVHAAMKDSKADGPSLGIRGAGARTLLIRVDDVKGGASFEFTPAQTGGRTPFQGIGITLFEDRSCIVWRREEGGILRLSTRRLRADCAPAGSLPLPANQDSEAMLARIAEEIDREPATPEDLPQDHEVDIAHGGTPAIRSPLQTRRWPRKLPARFAGRIAARLSMFRSGLRDQVLGHWAGRYAGSVIDSATLSLSCAAPDHAARLEGKFMIRMPRSKLGEPVGAPAEVSRQLGLRLTSLMREDMGPDGPLYYSYHQGPGPLSRFVITPASICDDGETRSAHGRLLGRAAIDSLGLA